jgi:type IV pilus assembly protein PilE
MPYPCPDCGTPVADGAVVCPRCGFPLRPDALMTGGGYAAPGAPRPKSNAAVILAVSAAVLFGGVILVGILAALAIPRFTQATHRAQEHEASLQLHRVYEAETRYHEQNQRFTPELKELEAVGWTPMPERSFTLHVVTADSTHLCVEADPFQGAYLTTRSIDSRSGIVTEARCGEDDDLAPPDDPGADLPGPSGDAGAKELLGEVYAGASEYHAKHGAYPTSPVDLLRHVHASRAAAAYMVATVDVPGGGLCAVATPRDETGHAFAVDGDGGIHRGGNCSGPVVDHVGESTDAAKPAKDE